MARRQVKSPTDIADLHLLEMSHLDQEHLRTVLLDTKNRVQVISTVYIGSLNASMVRVGELFKEAIRRNSAALIVVHNHPSGDPTPSPEDVLVTREIIAAGKLLDIDVLDHLVIGHGRFVSLRERGLGFSNSNSGFEKGCLWVIDCVANLSSPLEVRNLPMMSSSSPHTRCST